MNRKIKMNVFKIKRENYPSIAAVKVETGNIDLNKGISMVIYFLDTNENVVEKNVLIIQGEEFLNLGKNKNLRTAIIEKMCMVTGSKLLAN